MTDKTEHRNTTFNHKTYDEFSRVTDKIKQHGRDYLPESFNMDMCRYMKLKDNQKDKWMSPKGFDNHAGVSAPHVVKIKHPGNGKIEMHAHALNDKSTWKVCQNENAPGSDPYAVSYPEMTTAIM